MQTVANESTMGGLGICTPGDWSFAVDHEMTPLDKSVLETMASESTNDATAFAEQVRRATVLSRQHSGVGFFTDFDVPDDVPLLGGDFRTELAVVHSEHPDLSNGAGFVVFATDGKLSCLEAFTYGEEWPADESKFSISKLSTDSLGE